MELIDQILYSLLEQNKMMSNKPPDYVENEQIK